MVIQFKIIRETITRTYVHIMSAIYFKTKKTLIFFTRVDDSDSMRTLKYVNKTLIDFS